jgi:gluconokinase
MRQGLPLNDEDRQPWLERLRTEIVRQAKNGVSVVMACSALKKQYRTLLAAVPGMQFVYLKGTLAEVAQRLSTRREHFADEKILAGQFADLEEPDEAIVIEIHSTPEKIVGEIRKKLGI